MVARITMIVICVLGTILAITAKSVYELWVLTSDFVYALLFPQLLLVIYCKKVNTYGSLVGFVLGAILRFGGGQVFNLPKFLPYPDWFPFRTFAMIVALVSEYLVSALFYHMIVTKGKKGWDFMGDYKTELSVKSAPAPAEAKPVEAAPAAAPAAPAVAAPAVAAPAAPAVEAKAEEAPKVEL